MMIYTIRSSVTAAATDGRVGKAGDFFYGQQKACQNRTPCAADATGFMLQRFITLPPTRAFEGRVEQAQALAAFMKSAAQRPPACYVKWNLPFPAVRLSPRFFTYAERMVRFRRCSCGGPTPCKPTITPLYERYFRAARYCDVNA